MMRITTYLKTVSLTTIGYVAGLPLGVDIPLTRIDDMVYIPGSSVKGALRSSASRIAESYGFTSCGYTDPGMIEEAHSEMGAPCSVCKLFGEPKKGRGRILVSDFHPVGDVKTLVVTRVRIDDDSQKALEGSLYKMEHIEPGIEFKGYIDVVDPDSNDLALLLLSLAELRVGRFGRRSQIDIRVEADDEVRKLLSSRWLSLLRDLGGWFW